MTLNGSWPLCKCSLLRMPIFDEILASLDYMLWWKMTFAGRWTSMKGIFQWKQSCIAIHQRCSHIYPNFRHSLTQLQLIVRVTLFWVCTIFWHLLRLSTTWVLKMQSIYCNNLTQLQLKVRVTLFLVCTIFWHLLPLLPTWCEKN